MDFIIKHRLKQDEIYCSDDDYKEDHIFNIAELKKHFNVEKCGRGYVVWQDDDNCISFAVLDFFTAFDDQEHCKCIWHGEGFGDALRELRHSYFTSEYYFYLDPDPMEKLINKIKDREFYVHRHKDTGEESLIELTQEIKVEGNTLTIPVIKNDKNKRI